MEKFKIPILCILLKLCLANSQTIRVVGNTNRENSPDIVLRRVLRPMPLSFSRHNVIDVFSKTVPCSDNGHQMSYCNFEANNNFKVDATNYFPQGILKDHSFDCSFRLNKNDDNLRPLNSWNLINVTDISNGNRLCLRLAPSQNLIEVERTISGVTSKMAAPCPEIFDGNWHDVKYNLKNNQVTLFVDCRNKQFGESISIEDPDSNSPPSGNGISLIIVQTSVPENVDITKMVFNSLPMKVPHGIKCPEIEQMNKHQKTLKPKHHHIHPPHNNATTYAPKRLLLKANAPGSCTCNINDDIIKNITQSILNEFKNDISNLTNITEVPNINGTEKEPNHLGTPSIKGAMGIPGVPGLHGLTGLPGLKGDPGFPGLPGLSGIKGDLGFPGLPGLNGPKGMKGEKGDPASIESSVSKGEPGPPGVSGLDGLPGLPGLKGEKCTPGPIGPPGVKGERGNPGREGLGGVPGYPGMKGLRGEPGFPGLSGLKGDAGVPGLPGLDGTPGTPAKQPVEIDIDELKMNIVDQVISYVEQYIETRLSFDFPSTEEQESPLPQPRKYEDSPYNQADSIQQNEGNSNREGNYSPEDSETESANNDPSKINSPQKLKNDLITDDADNTISLPKKQNSSDDNNQNNSKNSSESSKLQNNSEKLVVGKNIEEITAPEIVEQKTSPEKSS